MRRHYTKPYIEEALLELLKERSFSLISVTDVVKKSGVSRASFYRNYLNLNQVIYEYAERSFEKQFGISGNMKESIYLILQHYYKHRNVLILLNRNKLLGTMDDLLYRKTLNEIKSLQAFNNKYQPYFFAGAAAGFVKGWIENDFTDPPELMVELFVKLLEGYMEVK